MDASRRLREAIHHTSQQCANDLLAQHTASDYALRKRIFEFRKAIDELEWQKTQVLTSPTSFTSNIISFD